MRARLPQKDTQTRQASEQFALSGIQLRVGSVKFLGKEVDNLGAILICIQTL